MQQYWLDELYYFQQSTNASWFTKIYPSGNPCLPMEPLVPAIDRQFTDADRDVPVVSTPRDTVTHKRGFGDSGYVVEIVEHDCPECGFDRMVRRRDIDPNNGENVCYWCLNPNCVYFVEDALSYAFHRASNRVSGCRMIRFETERIRRSNGTNEY